MHHRTIKATLRNNSIVMSQGQTILTAKLQTMLSSVTYSPITLSYGDQLVSNSVPTQKYKLAVGTVRADNGTR